MQQTRTRDAISDKYLYKSYIPSITEQNQEVLACSKRVSLVEYKYNEVSLI